MKNFIYGFLATVLLVFNSCQPYEDGPKISLRSVDGRLHQTWILKNIVNSDGSEVSPSVDKSYEFKDNGQVIISTDGLDEVYSYELNDKTDLKITYSQTSFDELKIKRLSKTDLWLEDSSGLYENRFISKN